MEEYERVVKEKQAQIELLQASMDTRLLHNQEQLEQFQGAHGSAVYVHVFFVPA